MTTDRRQDKPPLTAVVALMVMAMATAGSWQLGDAQVVVRPSDGRVLEELAQWWNLTRPAWKEGSTCAQLAPNFFCDSAGAVTRLSVSLIPLSSSIPAVVANLSSLMNARWSVTGLPGSIPTALFTLTNLTRLNIVAGKLNGSIPSDISKLVSLKELWLSTNLLTGPVPESLSALTALTSLVLTSNQLTGPMPASMSTLTALASLILPQNNLTGSIPSQWSTLTRLSEMNLERNNFSGSLALSLSNLTRLTLLSLANNQLNGTIPASFFQNMPSLYSLSIERNSFSGPLPTSLADKTNLRYLFLLGNKFSGPIPRGVTSLPNIMMLALSENRFTGSLGLLSTSLATLNVTANAMSGPIPESIVNCTGLGYLGLAQNSFSGVVPTGLRLLSNLLNLDLSNNQFYGVIADAIPMASLKFLDLSNNQFTGRLPDVPPFTFGMQPYSIYNMKGNFFAGPAVPFANVSACPDLFVCTLPFCPSLNSGFEILTGLPVGRGGVGMNCLTMPADYPCPSEPRRSADQCVTFCGLTVAEDGTTTVCGGHGLCYLAGGSKVPTCLCDFGYTNGDIPGTCLPIEATTAYTATFPTFSGASSQQQLLLQSDATIISSVLAIPLDSPDNSTTTSPALAAFFRPLRLLAPTNQSAPQSQCTSLPFTTTFSFVIGQSAVSPSPSPRPLAQAPAVAPAAAPAMGPAPAETLDTAPTSQLGGGAFVFFITPNTSALTPSAIVLNTTNAARQILLEFTWLPITAPSNSSSSSSNRTNVTTSVVLNATLRIGSGITTRVRVGALPVVMDMLSVAGRPANSAAMSVRVNYSASLRQLDVWVTNPRGTNSTTPAARRIIMARLVNLCSVFAGLPAASSAFFFGLAASRKPQLLQQQQRSLQQEQLPQHRLRQGLQLQQQRRRLSTSMQSTLLRRPKRFLSSLPLKMLSAQPSSPSSSSLFSWKRPMSFSRAVSTSSADIVAVRRRLAQVAYLLPQLIILSANFSIGVKKVHVPPAPTSVSRGLVVTPTAVVPVNSRIYFRHMSATFTLDLQGRPSWNPLTAQNWISPTFVTPVKDQGTCGACWGFATMTALEAAYAILLYGRTPRAAPQPLSVEQLLDCGSSTTTATTTTTMKGNIIRRSTVAVTKVDKCGGGWSSTAYDYASRITNRTTLWGGMVPSVLYPFSVADRTASCNQRLVTTRGNYSVLGYDQVSVMGWFGLLLAVQRQPVVVHIEANVQSFLQYDGTFVYKDPACFTYNVNHAVVLVGYRLTSNAGGATLGRYAAPYWIIQNSWGTRWGSAGRMYMDIQGGDGVCGINTLPGVYPVISRVNDPCNTASFGGYLNPCGDFLCKPLNGKPRCECSFPFVPVTAADGRPTCAPQNICELLDKNPCLYGTCVNDRAGGYVCICPAGYLQGSTVEKKPTCAPAAFASAPGRYTVQGSNVTCEVVGVMFGLSRSTLEQRNTGLTCSSGPVEVGRTLNVTSSVSQCTVTYTSAESDTCTSLATFFNITVDAFAALNPVLDCTVAPSAPITPGLSLCVERDPDLANVTNVCVAWVRVQQGQTCEYVRNIPKVPLSPLEFFRLNPGLDCSRISASTSAASPSATSDLEVCIASEPFRRGGPCPLRSARAPSATYAVSRTDSCAKLILTYFSRSPALFTRLNGFPCVTSSLPALRSLCVPASTVATK